VHLDLPRACLTPPRVLATLFLFPAAPATAPGYTLRRVAHPLAADVGAKVTAASRAHRYRGRRFRCCGVCRGRQMTPSRSTSPPMVAGWRTDSSRRTRYCSDFTGGLKLRRAALWSSADPPGVLDNYLRFPRSTTRGRLQNGTRCAVRGCSFCLMLIVAPRSSQNSAYSILGIGFPSSPCRRHSPLLGGSLAAGYGQRRQPSRRRALAPIFSTHAASMQEFPALPSAESPRLVLQQTRFPFGSAPRRWR